MTLALLCVAIAFAAGIIGATPKRAAIMAGVVGILAGAVMFLVQEEFHYGGSLDLEYLPAVALPPSIAAALMAFAVAKLKR
ncbi:TPA: hypothetical protein ACOFEK_001341 [Stenotrophomonas maltophilia]